MAGARSKKKHNKPETSPSASSTINFEAILREPHPQQRLFIESQAKRKVIRAGRRSGKTVGVAEVALLRFGAGRRVLYATPTQDQIDRFWFEVKRALAEPIKAGVLYKNETEHVIEVPNTLQRIRAKTAWNADTLRGDYADDLILDEYQMMNEDAWEVVGAPMLLDNNGDAVFIYTPPSIRTAGQSKAHDPRHAAKLFKKAQADKTGRWETFHFSSHDNPYLDRVALDEITRDITQIVYDQEILALDKEDNPAALWKRADIEANRVLSFPDLARIVVGVDPTNTSGGDEAGIVVDGRARIGPDDHLYVLEDLSRHGSPREWASAAVAGYYKWKANVIVAEANNGGEMVAAVISQVDPRVPVKLVHASRGKQTRAEPISALYEKSPDGSKPPRGHHVGTFPLLEDELCQWQPGMDSPNHLDAHVWAATELMLGPVGTEMKETTSEEEKQPNRWQVQHGRDEERETEDSDIETSRWKL